MESDEVKKALNRPKKFVTKKGKKVEKKQKSNCQQPEVLINGQDYNVI